VSEAVELVAFVTLTRVVADVVDTDVITRRLTFTLVHICVNITRDHKLCLRATKNWRVASLICRKNTVMREKQNMRGLEETVQS